MAVLPIAEILVRRFLQRGIPGSGPIVQHLTLWVGFLGAALAAREGKHLALATTSFLPKHLHRAADAGAAAIGAGVAALLARASLDLVLVDREAAGEIAAGIPTWVGELVLPISFALIALRLAWRAGPWWARGVAALGLAAGVAIGQLPGAFEGISSGWGIVLVVLGTLLGGPLFALLGGVAMAVFLAEGVPLAAVPAETYRLAVSPTLAAIPLFTLAGFLLAEGRASQRLLRLFHAFLGWLPGGTAVVCALLCAFFTAFTGGSGVTILALGGLLLQALRADGFGDRFSLGLLTAAGSLGLLFPPSVPLILFGVVAQAPIENLFLAGLVPGFLLVGVTAAWGIREGRRAGVRRQAFSGGEALRALWSAKWELAIPLLVVGALLSGLATVVEAAALAVLYVVAAQLVVHRDVSLRQLGRATREAIVVIGGVLVVLGAAMGLSSAFVDAEVPAHLFAWVQAHVGSQFLFLLGLNVFLLVVGSIMEVFAAIVVVAPLLLPLAGHFGVDPIHLGIVFVANLELGFMTPPLGLNLLLSSYRFERPVLEVARATMPMLALQAVVVLLVTYLPMLTSGVVAALGR